MTNIKNNKTKGDASMIKRRRCRTCNEKGYLPDTYETCPVCFGEGEVEVNYKIEEDDGDQDEEDSYH